MHILSLVGDAENMCITVRKEDRGLRPICYSEEERWCEVLGTDGNGEGCGRWQRPIRGINEIRKEAQLDKQREVLVGSTVL